MTDSQLELLFKAVKPDYKGFLFSIIHKENYNNEYLNLVIQDDVVAISFDNQTYNISYDYFLDLLSEVDEEKRAENDSHQLLIKRRDREFKKNNPIKIREGLYEVSELYFDSMILSRDIASAQETYKNKLRKLVDLLLQNNVLIINQNTIKSPVDLEVYLKKYFDFASLDDELYR